MLGCGNSNQHWADFTNIMVAGYCNNFFYIWSHYTQPDLSYERAAEPILAAQAVVKQKESRNKKLYFSFDKMGEHLINTMLLYFSVQPYD